VDLRKKPGSRLHRFFHATVYARGVGHIIFTVTLNPALDEAVAVDNLALGAVNRCRLDALDAGGKGINASRVLRRLGRQTIALGFAGGVTGALLRERLDAEGVQHALDETTGLTRLNVMLFEAANGRRTRFYLPGATVEPVRLDGLRLRLEQAPRGGVVVLGGSVPPGLPDTIYRDLVAWLKRRGVRTVVDTSGAPLAAVLQAGPALIKPNAEEASDVVGFEIRDDADALRAAVVLHERGAENVVISQGAGGAIGVNARERFKAIPPKVEAWSTVGSGDSMVAGLAIALDEEHGLEEGLRLGTAAGAATAVTSGTHLCSRDDFERLLPLVRMRTMQPSLAG
jgi:1-phosphofructokinase family hexose kinase